MKRKHELSFAPRLAAWFQAHQRPMPWRENRDPYRVWVSEIMLQQTQVATVIPYFERFLRRFPTVHELAAAPLEDVLRHWSGLGYYSRARNLHRGARMAVERFGGTLPATPGEIREIPGIGAYTAGAILSIAYGLPEPLVDGNVARVLSRVLRIGGDVRRGEPRRQIWDAARELVETAAGSGLDPGVLNQGLMELGATVCTPRTPECPRCPLARACRARAAGTQDRYPQSVKRAASPVWHLRAWIVENDSGEILFARRAPDGLFGGLWELPMERIEQIERGEAALKRTAKKPAGKSSLSGPLNLTHTLTHRVLEIELRAATAKTAPRAAAPAFHPWSGEYTQRRWLRVGEALNGKHIGLPSVQKKLLKVWMDSLKNRALPRK